MDFIHFHGVEKPPPAVSAQAKTLGSDRHTFAHLPKTSTVLPEEIDQMDPFTVWLLRRAGIRAEAYRAKPIQRRLPACFRQLRVDSPEAARALLEAEPDLLPAALNCMLLGVTSFFRDTAVFNMIETEVLPYLVRKKNGLRVLGMGVSEGQELFSIAMLLAEAGALQRSSLLGVDCRPDAIKHAQAASFLETELLSVTHGRRNRFFASRGTAHQLCDELRSAVQWRVADLLSFSPPESDLILFRNVAIYLEDEPVAEVWRKLYVALAPGGYLVTGKAEKPPRSLPLHRVAPSVYRKAEA